MSGQTIRVKDVPQGWTTGELQSFLLKEVACEVHISYIDRRSRTATATCRVGNTVQIASESRTLSIKAYVNGQEQYIILDTHFHGVTTLYSPPIHEDHRVDIVAISGLGGHAYGSFKQKKGDHMWLRDTLPSDLRDRHGRPMTRIRTYGYESKVKGSTNTQNLNDLAKAFYNRLLADEDRSEIKPIIFVAHSLGGLIVKQALILLSRSEEPRHKMLLHAVLGIIFFGVPQQGMDVESLKKMAKDGPNLPLLESISRTSSDMEKKHSEFYTIVNKRKGPVMFAFYETELSPTAQQDKTGKWGMKGPLAQLVTEASATYRLPDTCTCPLTGSHSELVKFAAGDDNYKLVLSELKRMAEMPGRASAKRSQWRDDDDSSHDSEEEEEEDEEEEERGCYRCGYSSHIWRKCFTSFSKVRRTRRRRWLKRVCQLCGNPGHIEENCYFYDIF